MSSEAPALPALTDPTAEQLEARLGAAEREIESLRREVGRLSGERRPRLPRALKDWFRRDWALWSIGALSILLPAVFFVGLVCAWPQDDGMYFNVATWIARDGSVLRPFIDPKTVIVGGMTNPASIILARHTYNLVNALVQSITSDGGVRAAALSFACYGAGNLSTFLLLRRIVGASEAFIATFLLMVFPANLIQATRITPDLPMAALINVAMLLVMLAWHSRACARRFLFWSGVAFGVAVTFKEPALVMVWPLLAAITLKYPGLLWAFAIGAAAALLPETILYWIATGHPSFRWSVVRAAHAWKYFKEYQLVTTDHFFGTVRTVAGVNYPTLYHIRYLLHLPGATEMQRDYAGWGVAAAVLAWPLAAVTGLKPRLADPRVVMVIALVMGYAFMEFGFTDIFFRAQAPFVIYARVFKEMESAKLVLYLALPASVILAAALEHWRRRRGTLPVLAVAGTLAILSLTAVSRVRQTLWSGTAQLRQATTFLMAMSGARQGTVILADPIATELFGYFSDGEIGPQMRALNQRPEPGMRVFLVEGGHRGIDVADDTFQPDVRKFKEELSPGATLVERFHAEAPAGGGTVLRVFEVISPRN